MRVPGPFVGGLASCRDAIAPLANCIDELKRCVTSSVHRRNLIRIRLAALDGAAAHGSLLVPVLRTLVELDVRRGAVRASCKSNFHATVRTTSTRIPRRHAVPAVRIFHGLPRLRMIIPPAAGGAVSLGALPCLSQDMKRPLLPPDSTTCLRYLLYPRRHRLL